MGLVWKERLKIWILITLIITSLMQVGILWNYQNYGFPTDVFSVFSLGMSTSNSLEDYERVIRDKYFLPSKIILSAGYDNPRWIVDRQSSDYDELWQEARFYLESAMLSKPVQRLDVDEWGRLMAARSVIFEFSSNISKHLLAWFLDESGVASGAISGVYKMIILPEENLNYNLNTVYLRDESSIYKYIIQFPEGMMDRSSYGVLFSRYEKDENLIQYSLLKEKYNIDSIGKDVLGVIKGQGYKRYNSIVCNLPEIFKTGDIYDSSDVDKIADAVLGSEKYGYDRSWDSDNAIEFKTLNNIYRIFNDGLLDYRFLSGAAASDKGSVGDAFLKAAMFLEQMEPISSNPDVGLSLTKIEETHAYYRFYFDYTVSGIPVVVDYKPQHADETNLNNAFVIEANSKNVLKGYGILRKFEKGIESKLYNIMFTDLINDAYQVHGYSEFGSVSGIIINDIKSAYKVEYSTESQVLAPVWIITTPDRIYTIPMRGK